MTKKDQLVGRLMSLAYRVQRELPYGVFINYSGHVDLMEIRITPSKDNYQDKLIRCDFSVKRTETANIQKMVGFFEDVLERGEIDFMHKSLLESSSSPEYYL